ncbi:MAG: helix-turn-helix transcriptional regulator [Halanaerobiales bacterium]
MRYIKEIYRAVEYIEINLSKDITIGSTAEYTGYSVYYFSRLFNKITGHSPYDYIMRRRLSEAAQDLLDSSKRIIDIAYKYQFKNPETFTRAFTKMFCCLPSSIKGRNSIKNLVLKKPLSLDYLDYINKVEVQISPESIFKEKICLIGFVENTGKNSDYIYENLKSNTEIKILNPEIRYSLYYYPERYISSSAVFHGYETASLEVTPDIYLAKIIPPSKYIKINILTDEYKIDYIFQYLYQTKLVNEKLTYVSHAFDITNDLHNGISQNTDCEKISNENSSKTRYNRTIYIPIE